MESGHLKARSGGLRLSHERLGELLARFQSQRITVIGDFFLDKYLDVDPVIAERSIETGKRANQVIRVRHSPGAAGNVVKNITSLGAGTLHAVGIIGEDGEGYELVSDLETLGCSTSGLIRSAERMTPTYLKPRDFTQEGLEGEHERYDIKNHGPVSSALEALVIDALDRILPSVDGVVIIDQVEAPDCGVITKAVRNALSDRAARDSGVVFAADSRVRIRDFRSILVKPNQFEALGRSLHDSEETIEMGVLKKTLRSLRVAVRASVFLTCGERGILVSDPEPVIVPAVRLTGKLDTTGAGDSALAGIVLALTSGATPVEAAIIGNLVASITAEQLATTGSARIEELPPRFELWRSQFPE
jgi:rfaE bifunctional protein kinase chain/domain